MQGLAQYPQYEKNYFLFPIKPGNRNYLSGNMGELRNNHFHGGLDIKTDQREGLPVYACADGVVVRMVVSHKGYGNTLYIKHANGLMTVYAHLLWFHNGLSKFMLNYLYSEQCNETDLRTEQYGLQVKKGDIIALSGNTGSSGGPHLHWEIRDENENLLNPLFFDFDEIVDDQPPIINLLGVKALDIDSRVEGEHTMAEFKPVKVGSRYVLNYPIHVKGIIGIQIVTYDRMNGTSNLCGVSLIYMKVNGVETYVHDIQKLSFNDQGYINTHLDYYSLKKKGHYFQKCYVDDGNALNTYCVSPENGKIYVQDTLTRTVKIVVEDAYRNKTSLTFKLKGTPFAKVKNTPKTKNKQPSAPVFQYVINENVLKIQVPAKYGNKSIPLYIKNIAVDLPIAYSKDEYHLYLWDLRKALPDSLKYGTTVQKFHFAEAIPSKTAITYSQPFMDISFSKKSIFDTLYLDLTLIDEVYTIHNQLTPIFEPFTVRLYPTIIPENKSKAGVYALTGNNKRLSFIGGEWLQNSIKFKTKYFGSYTIASDSAGPKIYILKKTPTSVYIKATDYPSDIALWYAYLNGSFLLMHYDSKYDVLYTNPTENKPLKGTLYVGVVDQMGNVTLKSFIL